MFRNVLLGVAEIVVVSFLSVGYAVGYRILDATLRLVGTVGVQMMKRPYAVIIAWVLTCVYLAKVT